MTIPTEADVEVAALDWLESLGWTIVHGQESLLSAAAEASVGGGASNGRRTAHLGRVHMKPCCKNCHFLAKDHIWPKRPSENS